jgi:hypothetical protein
MIQGGAERKIVKHPDIEGEIRTKFESQCLGSIAGIEFHATVETELGTGNVKYLIRPADAETRKKLEWAAFHSMDELMEELNSPPSRMVPMFN